MPISLSQEMMREIIMDHYSNPRNYREEKDESYHTVFMDSTSCIDKIYVQAKIENDILRNADNVIIYCEMEARPEGWNSTNRPVYW